MIKKPTRNPQANQINPNYYSPDRKKTLAEHIDEIRFRLFWVVITLLLASGVGYFLHKQLLLLAQKPLGSELYYTSPGGGITFIFKLCFSFAFVVALPVILYHFMRFFFPVMAHIQQKTITKFVIASIILAYSGVTFAYFVSLPAALHFLSNIGNYSLSALITVDTYFDFVVSYLLGFAVLFQTPIIVLFINKIKPLTPGGMMRGQRYIVLASFIVAAILTPTPDPVNQTIMALPAIVLYQFSVFMVWRINKKAQPAGTAVFAAIPDEVIDAATVDSKPLDLTPTPLTLVAQSEGVATQPIYQDTPVPKNSPQNQRPSMDILRRPRYSSPVTHRTPPARPRVARPVMDIIPA